MYAFKVGDRVRFVGNQPRDAYHSDFQQAFGLVGTVVEIDGVMWPYEVRFDRAVVTTEGADRLLCNENEIEAETGE